jgi:hypothetical protein
MQQARVIAGGLRALGVVALAAAALGGWSARAEGSGEPGARSAVRKAAGTYAELERVDVAMLSRELDTLIADPALLEPFRARNRAKLLAVAAPRFDALKKRFNITHWYFHDREPARTCFLRVHAPATFGDVINRETLSQAIATQKIGAGKELGKTAFALRVVKPVRAGGELLGYMELGEEIDHFLRRLKAATGDDYALLVDKARVDRKELARIQGQDRWDERTELVLVESTIADARSVDVGVPLRLISDAGSDLGEGRDGGTAYAFGAFPVRDAANRIVGALFVRHRVSP